MRRGELASRLQAEYAPGVECGVARTREKGYENIWFVVPPPPPCRQPARLPADALIRANRTLASQKTLDAADDLDLLVSHLFRSREAVQSSRMEGTWSTIDDVLTPGELFDDRAGPSERASVLGYADALRKEMASVAGVKAFTVSLVQRLHRSIVGKDPGFRGRPGEIRAPGRDRCVVFIGGSGRIEDSIFNPPPPELVRKCLSETLKWMADEELREMGNAGLGPSLPIRLAVAHAHFEAVHPFSDGNGRVGRALMTLQISCEGKLPAYLSGYIEKEKREYVGALQQAQKKLHYAPIIEFLCEAIVAAHQESEETKACIRALPEAWLARSRFRARSAGERALLWMITNPIFTAAQLGKALRVSPPAAQGAVAQLEKCGIIRDRTGFRRNRVFAAEEVIALVGRDFGKKPGAALERARELLRRPD